MGRGIGGVVAGYALWTVIFLGGAAALRASFPGVHDADGFTVSTGVLLLYLAVSFLASLTAGWVARRVAGRTATSTGAGWVLLLGVALLATGIPVQLSGWDRIPLWYNMVFLIALIPLTLVGGRLAAPGPTTRS